MRHYLFPLNPFSSPKLPSSAAPDLRLIHQHRNVGLASLSVRLIVVAGFLHTRSFFHVVPISDSDHGTAHSTDPPTELPSTSTKEVSVYVGADKSCIPGHIYTYQAHKPPLRRRRQVLYTGSHLYLSSTQTSSPPGPRYTLQHTHDEILDESWSAGGRHEKGSSLRRRRERRHARQNDE